ncbi:MAG TPA: helix-turn-helix transcriptional regulator [Pseudolysinimonas sp.]|jgi:DNA-binding CsgD family transcriptional regulator|nr:helix-turn-helix transcriptional regulator [Pseudolysinimonas sp.]
MAAENDELLELATRAGVPARRVLDYLDARDTSGAEPTALAVLTRSRALRSLGRLGEAAAVLDEVPVAGLAIAERMRADSAVRLERGMIAFLRGDLPAASESLTHGLEGADDDLLAGARSEARGALAFAAFLVGRLEPARELVSAAGTSAAAGLASVLIELEAGRVQDAAARAAEIGRESAGTAYEALAWCVEAYALHAQGDDDEALARLWRLGDPGTAAHPPLTQFLATVGQLEVLTARHEFAAALGLLHTVEADPEHAVCPASWEARVLLETGDYARAIDLVEDCVRPGRPHAARTLAYALTVRAAALAGVRDLATADVTFQRALSLASVTGLRRHLAGLPVPLLSLLLTRAAAADLPESSHAVVLDIIGMLPTETRAAQPLLSARERIVLQHLAAGEPLQRVAWLLSVSPNTVKAQARSIYRKLGVDSRDSAVQRGRSLGLLG